MVAEKDGVWLKGLLREGVEVCAMDFGQRVQVGLGARPVRGTLIRILTGTGMREEARAWMRVG